MKENDYIPELNIKGGHNSIAGEILEKIREQMKINICIIESNKGNGTGFFCLIFQAFVEILSTLLLS